MVVVTNKIVMMVSLLTTVVSFVYTGVKNNQVLQAAFETIPVLNLVRNSLFGMTTIIRNFRKFKERVIMDEDDEKTINKQLISVADYNEELDEWDQKITDGLSYSHEEVMKIYRNRISGKKYY